MIRDKTLHHGNIIVAAMAEFLEYGFKDASMRRIASAAGMSVSGLYKHFPSKETLHYADSFDHFFSNAWVEFFGY